MTKTLENIAAGKVSKVLNEKGVPANKLVTVTIDESLSDIAKRTRQTAKKRGMTNKIFEELMKER